MAEPGTPSTIYSLPVWISEVPEDYLLSDSAQGPSLQAPCVCVPGTSEGYIWRWFWDTSSLLPWYPVLAHLEGLGLDRSRWCSSVSSAFGITGTGQTSSTLSAKAEEATPLTAESQKRTYRWSCKNQAPHSLASRHLINGFNKRFWAHNTAICRVFMDFQSCVCQQGLWNWIDTENDFSLSTSLWENAGKIRLGLWDFPWCNESFWMLNFTNLDCRSLASHWLFSPLL